MPMHDANSAHDWTGGPRPTGLGIPQGEAPITKLAIPEPTGAFDLGLQYVQQHGAFLWWLSFWCGCAVEIVSISDRVPRTKLACGAHHRVGAWG